MLSAAVGFQPTAKQIAAWKGGCRGDAGRWQWRSAQLERPPGAVNDLREASVARMVAGEVWRLRHAHLNRQGVLCAVLASLHFWLDANELIRGP